MFFIRYPKRIFFYIIISLISFVIIKVNYLSLLSSVFETEIVLPNSNHTSFIQQLFKERLVSYKLRYDHSLPVCNKTNTLNDNQKHDFRKMSDLLQAFRKQIVSYPTEYFNGHGIVLTAGYNQIKFARVNLKMIELTKTKLPVQVRLISSFFFLLYHFEYLI
jgi:hypothetical protein